jgi:hypothetical protein
MKSAGSLTRVQVQQEMHAAHQQGETVVMQD